MANKSRNARFFHPYSIEEISNPISRASHQVLWRCFTHCLKLKNTNRHLLASASFKAIHLGYTYASMAFSLVRVYSIVVHRGYVSVSTAYFVTDLRPKVLHRGYIYVPTVCSLVRIYSKMLHWHLLYALTAYSLSRLHSMALRHRCLYVPSAHFFAL